MEPLPMITMVGPASCFIFRTSAGRSPFTSFVLLHVAFSRVLENTTFGSLFMPSATSGFAFIAIGVGQ
jgi:hypothetical protein